MTSDTEFYSLSMNALSPPPPYQSHHHGGRTITGDLEKQDAAVSISLTRKFTSPLLEPTNTIVGKLTAWSNQLRCLILDWWLWELLSWAMSVLCTFAVALLIGYYDDQAIPDQWPLGITLNAYISVLGAVAKYTLAVPIDEAIGQLKWQLLATGRPKPLIDFERFDDASRGPWGAMALISRNRYRSIASLAATVTILSLALDPFFQQLVTFPKRPSIVGRSSVPRMIDFSPQRSASNPDPDLLDEVVNTDRWLYATLAQEMVNDGSSVEVAPYCPSEECAWSDFDTLGFCSQCQDVSSLLSFACLAESGQWLTRSNVNDKNNTSGMSCGYFLNATTENPTLMTGYRLQNESRSAIGDDEVLLMSFLNLQDVNAPLRYWDGSVNFKTTPFPIMDFIQVVSKDASAVFQNVTPVAEECVISFCTKRVAAFYREGRYTEQVVEKFYGIQEMPHILEVYNRGPFPDNLDFIVQNNITFRPPHQNSTFMVENSTALAVMFLLQDYAPSYVTIENSTASPVWRIANFLTRDPTYRQLIHDGFSSARSLGEFYERVTTALTNSLRLYPVGTDDFRGSGGMESYIHVRWGFFALPVVLLVFTIVVLAVTIHHQQSEPSVGVWKTSSIATLLHGLDDESKRKFSDTTQISGMFERSAMLKIALRGEAKQPKLVVIDEG